MCISADSGQRKKLQVTGLLSRQQDKDESPFPSPQLNSSPNSSSSPTFSSFSFPTSISKFCSFCITHSAKEKLENGTRQISGSQCILLYLYHLCFIFTKQNHTTRFLFFSVFFHSLKDLLSFLSSQKSAAIDIISFYRQLSSEVVSSKNHNVIRH